MAARRGHGEGSIYFEASRSRWVGSIDLPGPGGKRRRSKVTGKTKTAVRDRLKELQRQADAGLPVADGSVTFGQLLDRFLADVVVSRPTVKSSNTVDNYRWAIDNHLRPALGNRRLRALTPEDVESLLRSMADEKMAKSSIGRVRMVAATVLRHAQRRNMIDRNVAELADMPGDARPAKEGRTLDTEQAAAVLAEAKRERPKGGLVHPIGSLVVTGLMLGLRPGELCGLRWSDVDLEARVLNVRQARKREHDDEGHELLTFGAPKTKKSQRSARIPGPVVEALQAQKARQAAQRLRLGEAWTDLDLVFSTSVGTPYSPSNLRRSFRKLTDAAGIGAWAPKELRHSAASLLSAAGVPMEEVMDLLGHVDTRMLERVYRHRVRPTVEAAAAPMEALFG